MNAAFDFIHVLHLFLNWSSSIALICEHKAQEDGITLCTVAHFVFHILKAAFKMYTVYSS